MRIAAATFILTAAILMLGRAFGVAGIFALLAILCALRGND